MRKILLTFKSLVIAMVAMIFPFNTIYGQVATLQNWTNVYHGTSQNQVNLTYSVPTGSNSNRVLVLAVSSSKWSAGQITVTLSYGGQSLTLADGDMGTATVKQHTALYYLNEAGLDAATNSTLSATVSAGGATMVNTDIWAAVFDYVNQTSPLTNTRTYSSGTTQVTSFSFGTSLTINAYNQAVEVVNSYNPQLNTIRNISYAPNWTMVLDATATYQSGISGASIRNGVANRSIPNSNTSDVSSTSFSASALASMTALSLNYEIPPPPTVQTSNVSFSDVTTSSFTINWTSGNGTNRIVLVKSGSAVDSDPVDGTTYSASDLFGTGSQIGTGNYVVYNGSGYNVTVFNLDANTTYHVAVYEFSGPPGMEDYLTTDPARGSQLTDPETAITDDYRSNGSGNWSDAGIWQTYDGSSWVTAGSPPNSSSGIITIRTGHTITVADAVTVDQVVIETGAQITLNSGITWTIADGADAVDCNVDGILNNGGTIATTGVLAFNSGSAYNHNLDGGTIPTATWNANSTCSVNGIINTAPSGFGQSFGNFTWNCSMQSVTAVMNSNASFQSDFRLSGTGTGKLSITDSNNQVALTISGNYFQTSGTFDLNSGAASSAVASLNVAGNFSFTGGTITETSSSGRGSVVFNGAGSMQTYTSGGAFSNTIDFAVESGAYLQMGTGLNPSYMSISNGTFTLSSGATLGITDRWGITSSFTGSNGGNIRVTGTRSFNAGANYIYNGSNIQSTGDGLPATVNSLVFDNSGGAVTLNIAHTINNFSITSGSKANLGTFTHITSSLSLGGIGQPSGTYGYYNNSPTYFDLATGVVINQPPTGTWIGSTSTDWNTASNWIGGVPTSGTNAIIPSGPMYQPIVFNTPLAECNNLTIESGASLTINTGQALTAQGNINNSGTLNLNSSETGVASLIFDSYTDNGTENIQLFLSGGGDETNYPWHYISSPVATLPITDVINSGNDPAANDLVAYYENLVTDNKELAWIGYDGWNYQNDDGLPTGNTFSVLEVGQGYNYYSYYNATRIFGGNLNTEDVTKQISYTGATNGLAAKGWNLLGNPFTSGLNWDAITKPAGMDNAIYFTVNNTLASYVDGVSNNGATGLIPPMQGFFVKANQSGLNLTLPASARVHNFHSRYKGEAEIIHLIRLKIENNKISDETVIRFNEKAKNTFDSYFDAYKFGKTGTDISLWTTIGKVVYSINSIPFPETEIEVPVGVNISGSGNYKLTASQLQGIDNYNVYLIDKSTGVTVNLKTTPLLSFNTSEGILSNRFVIKIMNMSSATENPAISENKFNIYSSNGLINIQTLSDEWDGKAGSIGLIDMAGREITRIDNKEFWKNSLIQIPAAGLRGIYFVKMQSGLMRHVGKVMIR
jgi:hypothetical protein